ncbi:MAG: leucine-rich repeat domain-containing protein, partial [Oscillospiraceae bacterium]|nr:leucine-rich repeat domain-containing protein [Oscillospiraceae bacterium]
MKKRWHRGIALLAAASMCLMSVPVLPGDLPGAAIVASAETSGDFEYSVLEDGSVEISKYNGADKIVEIPAEIGGKPVTSIGYRAFYDCKTVESVTIPESVTRIGAYAFYECTALASVTIPEGVTSIEDYAFYGCTSLESVTIPEGVTDIGYSAFHGCAALASVT